MLWSRPWPVRVVAGFLIGFAPAFLLEAVVVLQQAPQSPLEGSSALGLLALAGIFAALVAAPITSGGLAGFAGAIASAAGVPLGALAGIALLDSMGLRPGGESMASWLAFAIVLGLPVWNLAIGLLSAYLVRKRRRSRPAASAHSPDRA